MRNKVVVTIAGREYTMVAVEDEAYVRKCAEHVDQQLKQVLSGHLAQADAAAPAFAAIGYEYLGEFGIAGRRYLRKGGDARTHQVHIFAQGDTGNIARHLAFRDYLRTHAAVREQYAQLKRALALRFPYDIEGYCAGKEAFVQRFEREALNWAAGPLGKQSDR